MSLKGEHPPLRSDVGTIVDTVVRLRRETTEGWAVRQIDEPDRPGSHHLAKAAPRQAAPADNRTERPVTENLLGKRFDERAELVLAKIKRAELTVGRREPAGGPVDIERPTMCFVAGKPYRSVKIEDGQILHEKAEGGRRQTDR
jgi:hypothetical protein